MENIMFCDTVGNIMVERIERDYDFSMITKHFHKEYELYYLLEGERYYFIDRQTYHVKKGSIVFVDQNQIHKTVGASNFYHDRILIQISDEVMKTLFHVLGNMDMSSVLPGCFGVLELNESGQQYIEQVLFDIIDEMKLKRTGYEYIVKAKVTELLVFIMRCKKGEYTTFQVETVKTEKHKKVHEIAEFVNLNYKNKLSLDDISKHFYVSKSYLSRIYKEVTGFTVNEYINIVRIKKAKLLLESTDKPITEVAEAVGYDSITYFEKVFKTYMETSPLKYRKSYKLSKKI
jgi:YesN/AraC family two-component response regulator